MSAFEPPPFPPPFLDSEQLDCLFEHGYAEVELPARLAESCRALFASGDAFFAQPECVKAAAYPPAQGTELGYYRVPDEKELLSLRHGSCDGSSSRLEIDAIKVWSHAAAFLHRILLDLGHALEIPRTAWDPVLDGCLSMPQSLEQAGPTLLRLLRYVPSTGVAQEHVDLGLLTMCFGSGRGLQVCRKATCGATEWRDARGPTVLVGRSLQLLSSGRVKAGNHRVVGNPGGRDSLVFPLRTSIRHEIPLVPFQGWGSVHGQEVDRLVRQGRVNINATEDVRARQRAEWKHRTKP